MLLNTPVIKCEKGSLYLTVLEAFIFQPLMTILSLLSFNEAILLLSHCA
jgi:hypothetical protein